MACCPRRARRAGAPTSVLMALLSWPDRPVLDSRGRSEIGASGDLALRVFRGAALAAARVMAVAHDEVVSTLACISPLSLQPQPVGLLRAPMPAQPGGDLVPQSRALGRLARFGAIGAVRLVTAGLGIPVALDLGPAGAGRGPAGGRWRVESPRQTVIGRSSILAMVERYSTRGFSFLPCARPAVAPRLAGAFRDAGVSRQETFLVQQISARLASQSAFLVGYSTPLNVLFPARSSFRWGHLTLLEVGRCCNEEEPAQLPRTSGRAFSVVLGHFEAGLDGFRGRPGRRARRRTGRPARGAAAPRRCGPRWRR